MDDCMFNPELIAAAGPFMGAALLMTAVQGVVVFRVTDRRARTWLLYGTFLVQAAALLAGMAFAFLHST